MHRFLQILLFLFMSHAINLTAQSTDLSQASAAVTGSKLIQEIRVYHDTSCQQTLAEVLPLWEKSSWLLDTFVQRFENKPGNLNCYWTSLLLINPDKRSRRSVLYFPRGWRKISCYLPEGDGTYQAKYIGLDYGQEEVLTLSIPAEDTLLLYIGYPVARMAYYPQLRVQELSEEQYLKMRSRSNYKYLLIGALLFPLFFFLTQFLVQRDRLTGFYIIFLLGASLNLLTILDTISFFALAPKVMNSMDILAPMFVVSIGLTIFGLVKYLHQFLDLANSSLTLQRLGNILLLIFSFIVLLPLVYQPLFEYANYEAYLKHFRVWALLLFLYILGVNIRAVLQRAKYSSFLLIAFSPLIISGLLYAISFVLIGNYTEADTESLLLIIGFILTSFLFGVILGVRNNAIKAEKLQLEQQTVQLKELDEFKSRFYTNITHEFRTPLTVVRGMASQISGQDKVRELILRNSDRLLNMVNQLLDLSRLERNSLTINWQQADIIPYLLYLTESCHSLSRDKMINLAFFSSEEKLIMDYDEDKIQQIVLNLVSNAIKFTPEYGSVKVMVNKIREGQDDLLQIKVKDTGKGIPEEKRARIFDRFYQVDDSNTRTAEGSGIGLALVKELVRLLAGRIEVDSELDRGTEFRIFLPIHLAADVVTKAPSYSPASSLEVPISESVIAPTENKSTPSDLPLLLIVEDNVDLREYIASCLQQEYTLEFAPNGKIGVAKALEIIPDVILCDIMMPEMDGYEVCRRLKLDRHTSHIPIILLTAKATQEDKNLGLSRGADAYLTKPFDQEELKLRLRNLAAQSKILQERLLLSTVDEPLPTAEEQKEAAFLQEVNQYIAVNLENELFDTHFLCRAMTMSRTQLHRKLKALTGQSTAKYIRSKRLQKALSLLQTTDLQIGEIADRVGFKDFSHFSRSFFNEFNYKPSEARK